MAEPARKINNDENRGIIRNRRLKLVPNKEKEKESEISGQLRQQKKAEADIRKEPVNLDDYRPQNRQIRQEQPQQSLRQAQGRPAPVLDLNERLKQNQAGGGGEASVNKNPFQGGGLDENLLRQQERERDAGGASELNIEKHKNKQERSKIESLSRTYESVSRVIDEHTKSAAIFEGVKLGTYLRREISEGKFDAFLAVLLLSVAKDVFDGMTLGTLGTIANIFVTIALFIIFFLQKSRFKRWLVKKYLGRYIIMIFVEFIPIFSIFPAYTVGAILLKLKVDKRIRKLEAQLEEVEKFEK